MNRPAPRPVALAGRARCAVARGPLRLDIYEDIDDSGCDGWVVDLVEAHLPDGPAGHLKISYIPDRQMHEVYPDPLSWMVRKTGKFTALKDLLDVPCAQWTAAQLIDALAATDGWAGDPHARRAARAQLDLGALRARWADRRRELQAHHRERYERFRAAHLDRPAVEGSEVLGPGARSAYSGSVRVDIAPTSRDLRRQGIGRALYLTGALWLERRALHLHASSLQSASARALWQSLTDAGLTAPGAGTLTLDPTAVARTHPELIPAAC